MALLNKVQIRALVRQLIDDPAGKLWSSPNLDLLSEGCLDELWGELLDQFPWIRSTEAAIVPIAPGYIDLSIDSLLVTRLYRVQQVVRDGVIYRAVDQRDTLISNGVVLSAPSNAYTIFNEQLHLFPYSVSTVYLKYVSRPEPFTSLGPGSDPDSDEDDFLTVDWPDGYHMAYIYDIASKAIEKGNREDSTMFGKRAEQAMFRLRAFLRRQSTGGSTMPYLVDSDLEWGGT